MQAGIPADIMVEMIHLFQYKVDFQRDLHPHDSFEVYYDNYYTPEGQPAKEGNFTYAMMNLGGKQIALYRYQPDANSPADYFDATGRSPKGNAADARKLSGSELQAFLDHRLKVDDAVAALPLETKVTDSHSIMRGAVAQ
jgi:hypothetical protein